MQKESSKTNKNTRLFYSIVCISIIALGVIVYFVTAKPSNSVNKSTTVVETQAEDKQVQNAVTVKETEKQTTVTQKRRRQKKNLFQ